jgi:hypothetical protein
MPAHGEAYALMTYRSDDGTEEEVIWNSRDGVTPFVITLRSGKSATHVDWDHDFPDPDHIPEPGERIFVDLTEERALSIARVNAERFWDHPELRTGARERFATVEDLAEMLGVIPATRRTRPDRGG